MTTIGNRIYTKINRPAPELIQQFKNLPVPNIADNMSRMFCAHSSIKAVKPEMTIVGCAFTVKVRPGDNLFLHKAIDMAQPGDVIVIDAQGDVTNSILGEIIARHARKRGIAGMVVDGSIRDYGGLAELDNFPVFSKGYAAMGPYKDGPGEINTVISCGGAVVRPGDIVVGDCDGVVFVPAEKAEEILKETIAVGEKEKQIFKDIENGCYDRTWVDKSLAKIGTEIIDDYCKF